MKIKGLGYLTKSGCVFISPGLILNGKEEVAELGDLILIEYGEIKNLTAGRYAIRLDGVELSAFSPVCY